MAEATRRLFLALWPGEAVAERLFAVSADAWRVCGGRRMRRETLHLTLAFLGEVAEGRLPELRAALAPVRGEAFRLTIDRLGYWPHNRIVWGGCPATPPALARLVADLRAVLAAAGFLPGTGAAGLVPPFVPHLTLLRKAAPAAALPDCPPIDWPVAEWVLVASALSSAGPAYTRLGVWPLE